AELLSEFVPPHEPNERIYRMTRICLETAAENPEFLEAVALYFEIWLLRLGGYLPSWEKCDNCKRQFGAMENASVQVNFHLLCENCQLVKNRNLISADLRKIYSVAQTLSPAKFAALIGGKTEEIKEVSGILKRLIAHILGKELKNDKILVAGL
ncbi:MAG TPA: DNA repair protein RecO, partial [Pyrinomonadaceae bacterium]